MAISLPTRVQQLLRQAQIKPILVLEIQGVSTIYSTSATGYSDESTLITLEGTTTDISQQLAQDRSSISSVSSMKINLMDKNDEITRLITPGEVVEDLLGRRARVRLGFEGADYPEHYITVFRGVIDDILSEQGMIGINIGHPDQKKRGTIFEQASTQLNGSINNSITTLTVDDTSDFLVGITGPDSTVDTSFVAYVRIDDELIQYTGKTATTLTGCTRGALGTTNVTHDDNSDVTSFYRLQGNGVDLALKIMLSGWSGPFEENAPITNFETVESGTVSNAIYFEGIDVRDKYGINEGDYITTTGASNGANNVSLKQIETIIVENGNSYIVISGVTFVVENATSAVIDFRSQYDTLPSGMKMHGDEVDVDQHLYWFSKYLSGFNYDFYLRDTVESKDFLDKEIYLPMSAYSLPRKSRASMGMHTQPLPFDSIITIDSSNITNPDKLKIRRQIGRNFYNTVVFKFDEDVLEDKFLSGRFTINQDSKNRIPVGSRTLIIESRGMRVTNNANILADESADRLLRRYKYGAEYFEDVQVLFSVGFSVEPGDIVYFNGSDLNISDISTGSRGMATRLFEVQNKKMNIKDGKVSLSLIDTNIALGNRYGLISPASIVSSGASSTQFTIQSSYASAYGINEYRKWQRWIGAGVTVRSADFSTQSSSVIVSVSHTNVIEVSPALSFTPSSGYIMELSHYNNQTANIKQFYTFMRDTAPFDDGGELYLMS